jgi:predicted short-subunit dehydrogenase-like oxidoreductase (DUF2520 family)
MDGNELAKPSRFALVGAGTVGTAVASLLQQAGHQIAAVASRTFTSAEAAAARLGADVCAHLTDLPSVDAILIGAPDRALHAVADELAAWPHVGIATFVHFAGATGIGVFRPLIDRGGRAAALHPVQACPDVDSALVNLPDSAWGVTTTRDAEDWGRAFVRTLRGVPVPVPERERPQWHAAAVTTSNGIAALLALGEAMLTKIGIADPAEVLGPLAAGTLRNARKGAGETLTGPLVRGDVATIDSHLQALATNAPELLSGYRWASATILDAAIRANRIDAGDRDAMRELLGADPGDLASGAAARLGAES